MKGGEVMDAGTELQDAQKNYATFSLFISFR